MFCDFPKVILCSFECSCFIVIKNISGGSVNKESTCNAGDPVSGRSPGEGAGCPVHYACLDNPMNGAWQATFHEVTKSDMTEQPSLHFRHILLLQVLLVPHRPKRYVNYIGCSNEK